MKVSPTKGVVHFCKRSKLSPIFEGPFEILEKIGLVAYRLALPPKLGEEHNAFHMSQLQKYVYNLKHVTSYEELDLDPTLIYEEGPGCILDRKFQELRNKKIPIIKVFWKRHGQVEAIWELEDKIKEQYPNLP